MCFNEAVSWTALGVGIGFNVLTSVIINDSVYYSIAMIWTFVILMQMFEGLAYRARKNNDKSLSKFAVRGAMGANLSQPIASYAFLALTSRATPLSTSLGMLVTIAYAAFMFTQIPRIPTYNRMRKAKEPPEDSIAYKIECAITECIERIFGKPEGDRCGHFYYAYWDEIWGNATTYIIALFLVILFTLRPISYMIYQLIMIYGLLIISAVWFGTGTASVWCLYAAFTPVVNGIAWYLLRDIRFPFEKKGFWATL